MEASWVKNGFRHVNFFSKFLLQKCFNIKNHSRAHQWLIWGQNYLHKQNPFFILYIQITVFCLFFSVWWYFWQPGIWRVKTMKKYLFLVKISKQQQFCSSCILFKNRSWPKMVLRGKTFLFFFKEGLRVKVTLLSTATGSDYKPIFVHTWRMLIAACANII